MRGDGRGVTSPMADIIGLGMMELLPEVLPVLPTRDLLKLGVRDTGIRFALDVLCWTMKPAESRRFLSAPDGMGEASSWVAGYSILLEPGMGATASGAGDGSSDISAEVSIMRGGEGAMVSARNSGVIGETEVDVIVRGYIASREGVVGISKVVWMGVTLREALCDFVGCAVGVESVSIL